jgi:hypothetical protein
MFTERDPRTKIMGFGSTKEEAQLELEFNKARSDISNDLSGIYLERRKELYSWLPLPTMLVIKSVCGISYDSTTSELTNTATGKSVILEKKPLCQYLCLFNLIDGQISFEDFTVTVGKEIDSFMSSISADIGHLDDFPYTKPGDMTDAIDIHYLSCGGFVSETKNNSLIVCNSKTILSIDLMEGIHKDCLIAYGLAKLGILYDGKSCRRF